MSTATNSSVLQDVVAYVDVWSSDRTANYSQPFIQQLQNMGAQVTKTFNKQVTHVVFGNGHSATWRKAKNSNVRLVSVLWVGRCYDDGVRADEELFPALDESNPVLKNKKHRCMQPKDSPEKTPDSDRRMKKKLDKLMKGFVSKQPPTTASDVSPIIIDGESGIVYSPALKRSDYMAQRLKDMKEKREHLSPTASQMLESCSPTELKPSLGSTPTVLKLTYDESDPDPSTSAAAPTSAYSPHKEKGTKRRDFSAHSPLRRGDSAGTEPWLSPCCDVPKGVSGRLKCPDFSEEEDKDGDRAKKSRTSVRKKAGEKHKSTFLLESPSQAKRTDNNRGFQKGKRRSQIKSCSSSPRSSEKGKQEITETNSSTDAVNSSSCCLKPISEAVMKVPEETFTSPLFKKVEQKTPKRARLSLSSLVKSFRIPSDSKRASSGSADGVDDVFEDYFSTPDHQRKSNKQTLSFPELPEEIPFELEFGPKKRKQSSGQSATPEPNSKKKKQQRGKDHHQQSEAVTEPVTGPQAGLKESRAAPGSRELMAQRQRQSTLPFTSTGTTRASLKRRRASVQSLTLTEGNANDDAPSKSSESRGDKHTAEASLTELPSEGEEDCTKQVWNPPKTVGATKAMRTLVMTSMPTEKQQVVSQVVKALGGFAIIDEVCESTTHVVSGGHRRTLNILLGIARGCWILSFEWILWCLEQRRWIPEEPYELSDQFPAAQICRLQRHLSAGEHQQDLFQSLPAIFVSQHSQPPTQSLVELIQLCGGTVCKTVRQAGICIGRYSGRRPEGSRILSEQWVLDSIIQLRQLSYEGYDLD